MVKPRTEPEVSQSLPWRQVRSVMALTVYVALISLGMKGCAQRSSDEGLLLFWAPMAIALGLGSFWFGRMTWAALHEPARERARLICPGCGAPGLQTLIRRRVGRDPLAVGLRCSYCRTTYRDVGGRVVGFAPVNLREPDLDAGIQFQDDPDRGAEIRFLDEAGPGPPGGLPGSER